MGQVVLFPSLGRLIWIRIGKEVAIFYLWCCRDLVLC
jgi:hypothetical protein